MFKILRRKKGMALKLYPLIEYEIRNIFMEKSCRKCALEASPRPLFYFGKKFKTAMGCNNFFRKDILIED